MYFLYIYIQLFCSLVFDILQKMESNNSVISFCLLNCDKTYCAQSKLFREELTKCYEKDEIITKCSLNDMLRKYCFNKKRTDGGFESQQVEEAVWFQCTETCNSEASKKAVKKAAKKAEKMSKLTWNTAHFH